jgi:hypothetical protein
MTKSVNNDQYLDKNGDFSPHSQKHFDLRTVLYLLSVFTRVWVLDHQKNRSQAKFTFDAVDAASYISGNYGTIFLKLCENKYFTLRYLPFQRAHFIVLNPNVVNNFLFSLRVRTSVAPGRPLRVVSRQTGQRPEGQPRKCDLRECRKYYGSRGRLARVDAHRADP